MSIRTLSVTYVENYEYTNKDLRALSRKQISLDLRVFGVKFQAKIFIRVKNLTFRNSARVLLFIHRAKLMKNFHLPVDKKILSTFCR